MTLRLSDHVRVTAQAKFIKPASHAGKREVSIPVRDLMKDLEREGFPRNHTPQICSALQTKKFLLENGLEIIGIDGPDSKTSTTVVFHYRINVAAPGANSDRRKPSGDEKPQVRARRLTEKLRGLLKQEIAAYGGAEAFIQWVRSEEDEDAA